MTPALGTVHRGRYAGTLCLSWITLLKLESSTKCELIALIKWDICSEAFIQSCMTLNAKAIQWCYPEPITHSASWQCGGGGVNIADTWVLSCLYLGYTAT